jgi:hypothetical protein
MPRFPYKFGDTGDHILALNRKLASIERCKALLTDPRTSSFTEDTQKAILAFKRRKDLAEAYCDEQTWHALDKEAGTVFTECWQYELDVIDQGRKPQDGKAAVDTNPVEDEDALIARAHEANLAGLAFSGGGIRSATFNLGILQALAEREMLPRFDYLSTVSGGGYIGSWFSRWLKEEKGAIDRIQSGLTPGTAKTPHRDEREEIGFLRKYSNYLTPKTGLFSADTWALLATYFRNTVLNLTILTALIAAVMAVPYMLVSLAGAADEYGIWFARVAVVSALWSVFYIALSICSEPGPAKRRWRGGQTQGDILKKVVLPLMVSAFTGSIAIWHYRPEIADLLQHGPANGPDWAGVLAPGTAYFAAWSAGWFLARQNSSSEEVPKEGLMPDERRASRRERRLRLRGALKHTFGHFAFAVIGFGAVTLLLASSVSRVAPNATAAIARDSARLLQLVSFGMDYMLSLFGVAMILTIGLVGRMYADKDREWWARQGGWTAICTLAYLGLSAVSLYGPALVDYLSAHLGQWGRALVASSWFGTVVAGVLAGRSGKTAGKPGSNRRLEWLAALAPPLFAAGALLLVSTLTYFILVPSARQDGWGTHTEWAQALESLYFAMGAIDGWKALGVATGLALAGLVLSWRVDINKFSLHMMYRNRLVRAYLGAINKARRPHPFTGFDDADDIRFDELQHDERPQRPLHLVNTAMNITAGKELAWQTRKAASFTFSPAFCGFELPVSSPTRSLAAAEEARRGCYRRTSAYRKEAGAFEGDQTGISLGMAMAVSGAAVNPNMGYHSSPALAFLMTLFNVRLGRWFANPLSKHWRNTSPSLGIRHLLAELFGLSDSQHNYLQLSDGGHFENLGIYELVRRRCKNIIAVDAGADGDMRFEDLGNAIRKCATDLHIDIDIDVGEIECIEPTPYSRAYYVKGKIRYSHADAGKSDGDFLYIKPSLLGNERADIKNYKKTNEDFPHQSTADQWFDETQFESYRSLGYQIGKIAFGGGDWPPGDPGPVVPSRDDAATAESGSEVKTS